MERRKALAVAFSCAACWLALGLCGSIFSARSPAGKVSLPMSLAGTTRKFSPAQLAEDFQITRRALEQGHIGIYRYTSKAVMDGVFDRMAMSLDKPMDALEFYRLMAATVAAIKCGHTGVELPTNIREEIHTQTPLLPVRVRILDKKVFVFRDFSSPNGDLAGGEIRSVNGVQASQIVETMLAATPGDGDAQTSRPLHIGGWRFAEHLVTLLGLTSPYDLAIFDRRMNSEKTVTVNGVALPKLREAWRARYPQDQPSARGADLAYHDGGRIAVMTIRNFEGFADAGRQQRLEAFLGEAFQEFQAKRTPTLIIDLRNNGGGYDHLGALLLAYLVDKPFKHYEDIVMNNRTFDFLTYAVGNATIQESFLEKKADGRYHLTGHPTWGTRQPVKPTFTGKVFVVINGRSFSTTSEFIAQAHFHRRATFIGEEAGGNYYGNTAGFMPVIELPNTRLRVEVPLVAYRLAVSGYPHKTRGLLPNHTVAYTIEELLSGLDKEMELALSLARNP